MADPKSQWPECVEKTGEEAKAMILQERPELEVEIMKHNQPATMDFRPDRVRVVVDDNGKVMHPPYCG